MKRSKAAKTAYASCEAKVTEKERYPLLFAYGEVYAGAVLEAYRRCLVGQEPWGEKVRKELVSRGWREDEADSAYDTARAAHESAVESTKLALGTAREHLEEVGKRLAWAMAGTSNSRVRRRHGLVRRRDILSAKVARLEDRLATGDVRVCFGGRKLALAGNDPVAHGYRNRDEWRGRWHRARSGTVFIKGDAEASFGNSSAKVVLGPDAPVLRLRVPDMTTGTGVRLRDLSGGEEWVEIPLSGFGYNRDELGSVLVHARTAAEARADWEVDRAWWHKVQGPWAEAMGEIGELLSSAEAVIEKAEAAGAKLGGIPRSAGLVKRLSKPVPTTQYKARRSVAPVSVRACWRERKGAWYVVASWGPLQPAEAFTPSRALRRRFSRVLGIDLNPDHVAWCLVGADGNPLAFGKVDLGLSGTSDENEDAIGRAVAELVSLARRFGAPIAHETLDFSRSRANLRYGCSKRVARLLSSFAYNKFFGILSSRTRREGVARIPVDPAWTSVLGQANYAGVYGVSVDQGAACTIARRSLGFRERVRPTVVAAVARQHPRSGAAGHMHVASVAKALPKRRSTWEPSGMCLRHSAYTKPHSGADGAKARELPSRSLLAPTPTTGPKTVGKVVPSSDAVATALLVRRVHLDGCQ